MNTKKIFFLFVCSAILISCNNKEEKGRFTLNGMLKNVGDQQVYLEELYFSQQAPMVLDTAEIKNGQFKVSAIAGEEGLYRIRLEKMNSGFVFINDIIGGFHNIFCRTVILFQSKGFYIFIIFLKI